MAVIEKYIRQSALPHIWCPGCGNGILLAALLRAIDKQQLDQKKTVIVSGIGCSSRASGYMNFNTIHTAHGRALPFATGIKLANPELNVIVITGDGDSTAIGGNHFIHAARRNIGLTTIIFDNNIYGMTGGQSSPLTPQNSRSTTAGIRIRALTTSDHRMDPRDPRRPRRAAQDHRRRVAANGGMTARRRHRQRHDRHTDSLTRHPHRGK